jgi:hypothetical protein
VHKKLLGMQEGGAILEEEEGMNLAEEMVGGGAQDVGKCRHGERDGA